MNKGNSSTTSTGRRKGGETATSGQRTTMSAQNQVSPQAVPTPVSTLSEVNANFINAKVSTASSVLSGRVNGPIVPDGNIGASNYDGDPSESEEDEDDDELEVESFADPDDDVIAGTAIQSVDPETRARLQELLDAADPEVIRKLRESVNCVMGEATAARSRSQSDLASTSDSGDGMRSLVQACTSGDIDTVRMLLKQGSSVHETTEDGESLLSLAASAGYFELCQVLIAMNANVEDRGVKGDCTPLMEAANAGYADIVKLLCSNCADVNAKSSVGNTALHYAACAGHESVVVALIDAGANVEEHNENGHTPLMEAASAGFVSIAKMLLNAGAGINTHSNEFKESALTLACYKGHLEMVKFLLQAGADQEHKTDEMHTALMEASMDGHVDVARLLLDSGAQVNMPTDSFESPLTLAACGGHVELANLLIERGANLEEANDEGYTPLMEAAREGHEEMCALLLAHGVDINAQTEETQETALTLACCGGFLEVADFLIKAGADIELGCSTPLMEASQEGHIALVKYLLKAGANVHAQTQTGDTALTYACENGHTDVSEILLEFTAELEHESEGGRTALMKAARVGHLCTVQFLINRGANVNKATTNSDHTVLSVACAGGHLNIVELLLKSGANPTTKLKDGSTMLIEAAKGGHTSVVNLLLDWTGARTPSSDDQSSSSQSSLDIQMQAARVPVQGLGNLVPHSQDCLTTAEAAAYSCIPATAGTMAAISNFATSGGVPGASALSWNGLPIQYDICETHGCSHAGLVLQSNAALDLAGSHQGCPGHAHLCMSGHQHDDCKSLSCASLMPYVPTTLTRSPTGAKVVAATRSSTLATSQMASGAIMIPANLVNSASSLSQSLRLVEGYDGSEGDSLEDQPSSSSADLLDMMEGSGSAVDLASDTETEAMLDFIAEEILNVNDRMRDCDSSTEGERARRVLSSEELKGFIHSFIESAQRLGVPSGSDTEATDSKSVMDSEEQAARKRQISDELRQIKKMLARKNMDASLDGSPRLNPKSPSHSNQDQQDTADDLNSSTEAIGTSSFNVSSDSNSQSSSETPRLLPSGENQRVKEESHDGGSAGEESRKEAGDGREEISNVLTQQDCEDALNIISNEIANLDLDVSGGGKEMTSCDQQDMDMRNPNIDLSTVVLLTDMHLNDGSCQHQLSQHNCLQQQQYQLYQHQQLEKMMQVDPTIHWHHDSAAMWQHQQLSHLLSNDLQQQQQNQQQLLDQHQLLLLSKQQQDEQMLAAALKQQQLQQLQASSGETRMGEGKVQATSHAAAMPVRDASSTSQPRPKQLVQQQNTQTQGRVIARPTRKLQQNHQLHLQVQQQLQQQKNKQQLEQQTTAFQFEGQPKGSSAPTLAGNVVGSAVVPNPGMNVTAGGSKGQVWQKRSVPQGGDPSAITSHSSLPQPLPKFAKYPAVPYEPNQIAPPRSDLHHMAMSGQVALTTSQSQANHSTANNFIQSQHICQQQLCSVPLDMQQLKMQQQQQQFGKQQLGQQYLQQQELLQQAQQLQIQLQQTQHLHHIMAQKQPGNAATSVATSHTQHELLLQAQQFQHLLQSQQIQQQYGIQKHLHPHTYQNMNTAAPVLGSPLQLAAVGPGNFVGGSGTVQKGPSLKGIVPAPFHFSPQQLQQQPQLLTQQGNIGIAAVSSGYESCMGNETGLMAVTSGILTNTSQATQTAANQMLPPIYPLPSIEVDAQTEGNHDTALTLACAGGHTELVSLLLSRGADIEHRDKKGFTPLILASTGGHTTVVEILLDNGADIEAQSERTKDSPLSLACSGGRYEVVELLLNRSANKEHRNVSDYTPLSLAASGGYVNIIKLLLQHGAEINSRTGSKLGISPLMLAAMNGHTTAVNLLLDMGSDINAQIETNRNTALTLACFQGRHEVVSLLVNRRANIEHRAKTGLTPLMEAASGGYVEVGRVLLDKGADIHAAPVPSSRDTVLTIASDKGHYRFVELLIGRHAAIDVKNKKGNSPLWLACNGGHLEVVQLLVNAKADVDCQDNRKVSCLMAAFRKGHIKVVKWLVKHVTQFPSDAECMRYIATVTDKDLLKKCHQCMELIVSAKDRQAAEANKNASILLEELDQEKSREESKRLAAARKREKKKQKKKDKLGVREDKAVDAEDFCDNSSEEAGNGGSQKDKLDKSDILSFDQADGITEHEASRRSSSVELVDNTINNAVTNVEESKRNVDGAVPSQGTSDKENKVRGSRRSKKKKDRFNGTTAVTSDCADNLEKLTVESINLATIVRGTSVENSTAQNTKSISRTLASVKSFNAEPAVISATGPKPDSNSKKAAPASFTSSGIGDLDDFGAFPTDIRIPPIPTVSSSRISTDSAAPRKSTNASTASSKTRGLSSAVGSSTTSAGIVGTRASGSVRGAGNSGSTSQATRRSDRAAASRKEELDWKEVTRKGRKLHVPSKAISRIIGRGGCNINAIRDHSGAHIDLDKVKESADGIITIRGSLEAQRIANDLLEALIREPDKDVEQILPAIKASISGKVSSGSACIVSTSIVTPLVPVTAVPVNVWKTNISTAAAKLSASTGIESSKKSAPIAKPLMETSNMSRVKTETGVFVVPGTGEDRTSGKPQPIKSFPIGAWTPVSSSGSIKENSGHSSGRRGIGASGTVRGSGHREATTVVVTCVSGSTSSAHRIIVSTVSSIVSGNSASKQSRVSTTVLTATVNSSTPAKNTDPVPLPIINGSNTTKSGRLNVVNSGEVSGMGVNQGSGSIAAAAGEYSPFSVLFSPLSESVMQKRGAGNNGDGGRNFASVAAAGVVTCSAHSPTSCASSQATSIGLVVISTPLIDSALQAKAPGYRPPSSFASPRIDSSTVSSPAGAVQQPSRSITEAPDANNFSKQLDFNDEVVNKDLDTTDGGVSEQRPATGFGHFGNEPRFDGSSLTGLGGVNGSTDYDEMVEEDEDDAGKEYDTGIGINVGNVAGLNTEYSSPRHPMTLPRIDSNLNPYAPKFTSKVSDSSYPGSNVTGDSVAHTPSQLISLPSNSSVGPVSAQYFSMQPKISFLPHQMPAMAGLKAGIIPGTSQGFGMMSGIPQPSQFGTHLVGVAPPRFDDPSSAMMFGMGGFSVHSQQHAALTKTSVEAMASQGNVSMDTSLGQAMTSKSYGPGMVRVNVSGSGIPQQSLDVENSTPSSSNPPSPSSSSSTTDAASRPLQPIGTERLIKKPRVVPMPMPVAPTTHFNMMASNAGSQPAWTFGSGLPGTIGTTALMHPPDMSSGDWAPPAPPPAVSMPPHQAGPHGDCMTAPAVPASPIECLSGAGQMMGLPNQPMMPPMPPPTHPSMLPHGAPYMSNMLPMQQGIMPGAALDHRTLPGSVATGYEPHTLQSMMTRGTSLVPNGGLSGMNLVPGAQMLTFPPPMPSGADLMTHPPNTFPPNHVEPWAAGMSQMKSTGNPQYWNMWKTS